MGHSSYSCIALVFLWKTKRVAEPLLYDKSVHLHLTLDYVARGMCVRVTKTCVLLAERPNRPNRPKLAISSTSHVSMLAEAEQTERTDLATHFNFFLSFIAMPTQTSTIFAKVGCTARVVK
jgi:hypothetical protein